jgi:Xaa-Pro aminopeptidase
VSDITCSFPISKVFSSDQRGVYEGVLSAQRVVYEAMIPGASWVDCHRLAEREILSALQGLGILRHGFTIDELAKAGIVRKCHSILHIISRFLYINTLS